jgi:uncharacterized protein (DUF433 family)
VFRNQKSEISLTGVAWFLTPGRSIPAHCAHLRYNRGTKPDPDGGRRMTRRLLGRTIVADDAVCRGKPTFVGTRIMVADVLEMVAMGMDWDTIIEEWRGSITREAIAEAISWASQIETANLFYKEASLWPEE